MRRVICVGKYGNILENESYDDEINHNQLLGEMFKDLNLTKENLNIVCKPEQTLAEIWPIAAFVTQNLEYLTILEDEISGKENNSIVLFLPEHISDIQINYFNNFYQTQDESYMAITVEDGIFSQGDKIMTFEEMMEFINKQKEEKQNGLNR